MYLEISNPMDYHVALYIRLSKEDESEGPSQSVTKPAVPQAQAASAAAQPVQPSHEPVKPVTKEETRQLYTDFVPDFSALSSGNEVMQESSSPEVARIMLELARKQAEERTEQQQNKPAQKTVHQEKPKPEQKAVSTNPPLPQPEQTTLLEETKPAQQLRFIGIAFATYWIFECGDKLLLLDQHAAHERLLYEKLKKSISLPTGRYCCIPSLWFLPEKSFVGWRKPERR